MERRQPLGALLGADLCLEAPHSAPRSPLAASKCSGSWEGQSGAGAGAPAACSSPSEVIAILQDLAPLCGWVAAVLAVHTTNRGKRRRASRQRLECVLPKLLSMPASQEMKWSGQGLALSYGCTSAAAPSVHSSFARPAAHGSCTSPLHTKICINRSTDGLAKF